MKSLEETLPSHTINQDLITDSGFVIKLATEVAPSPENKDMGCLVVGGFMSTQDTNIPFRSAFVEESGIDTTTMSFSEIGLENILQTDQVRIEDVEAAIREISKTKNEIIVIAHSMGASIVADTILKLNSELLSKVKVFVMVNGAGLIKKDGIDEVAPRVYRAYKERKEEGKGYGKTVKGKATLLGMAGRLVRLAADGINAARNKSLSEIGVIKAKGICVINIVSQYDHVFPDDLVDESTANLPIDIRASIIGGSHSTPSDQPQELAKTIANMIGIHTQH